MRFASYFCAGSPDTRACGTASRPWARGPAESTVGVGPRGPLHSRLSETRPSLHYLVFEYTRGHAKRVVPRVRFWPRFLFLRRGRGTGLARDVTVVRQSATLLRQPQSHLWRHPARATEHPAERRRGDVQLRSQHCIRCIVGGVLRRVQPAVGEAAGLSSKRYSAAARRRFVGRLSVGPADDLSASCWSVHRIPTHGRMTPCAN